jgi:hypothetical protein
MSSDFRHCLSGRFLFVSLLLVCFVLSACATTRQRRSAEPSGFLGDYSDLRKGEGDEGLLDYVNPAADFSQYSAVLIDSVTLWRTSETAGLSAEERQALTDYLYSAIHKQLREDYEIANAAGIGVMRLRAAITEAEGAKVLAATVTSVVPQMRMLTTLGGMATDTAALVAKVGLEGEITDSLTGVRLMAMVDRRAGTKSLSGGMAEWSRVEKAFDFWAERLRKRLAELRGS